MPTSQHLGPSVPSKVWHLPWIFLYTNTIFSIISTLEDVVGATEGGIIKIIHR